MRFRQGSSAVFEMSLLLAVLTGPGCALFTQQPVQTTTNKIPALKPPPDAVALDIVFVERPRGDELLGPRLWHHVDEVGSLNPTTRNMLRTNGLRIGVSGSDPPPALQTLLGLRTDFSYEPSAEQCKQLIGRQVMLRSGGETEILSTPRIEQARLRLPVADDPAAPWQTRSYESAHGLLRLTVTAMSVGTWRPAAWMAARAPMAMTSLAAKTASGRVGRANSACMPR